MKYAENERFTLFHGDNRAILPTLPENSVDAIVTDPPYELGFMGKSWDASGVAFDSAMWREALRVLKPGGHLLAFSGSRTYHRMAVAIEDAGFEIRDQIMWIYGSGFPKSLNIGKQLEQWQGWGTALKPAHEPIVVARKPLIGTVAANVLTYGTGGLNIDASRVDGVPPSVPQPALRPNGNDLGHALGTGKGRNGEMSQAAGRWPANVIHDGSDEVVELFPTTKPSKSGLRNPNGKKSTNAFGDYNGQPGVIGGHDDNGGSAARFFYCAKANKRDRNEGLESFQPKRDHDGRQDGNPGGSNPRNRTNTPKVNHHPTVKPTDLMRYLCRLVTPPNGVVLDPFTGSGSTGKAAIYEGFNFIGIEMAEEYLPIAKARIEFAIADENQKLL